MEENGKSPRLPRSVSIPEDYIPSNDQMIQDIWVDVKMLKVKVYGDKEKQITGVIDDIHDIRETQKDIKTDIAPVLDTIKIIKGIGKLIFLILGTFGLGKILLSWLFK